MGFDQEVDWKAINNGHTIMLTPETQSMKVRGGGLSSDKGARLQSALCQTFERNFLLDLLKRLLSFTNSLSLERR